MILCTRSRRSLAVLGPGDAHAVETFRAYLEDAALCGVNPGGPLPATFEAREFLARWRPYMLGQYPGPVETDP